MNEVVASAAQSASRLTEDSFLDWIGQALPGDQLVYHRGVLALDMVPTSSRLPAQERIALSRIARRALWAEERRLVHLTQRRHGEDDYSYMAIVRRRFAAPASATATATPQETV